MSVVLQGNGVCRHTARMADTPRMGRPTAAMLKQRQVEEILDRHADGESLEGICLGFDPPLPTRSWRKWVRDDPKLKMLWDDSDRDFVHALFDRYAQVTEELRQGPPAEMDVRQIAGWVNSLKAAQDGYKSICARLNPAKYAEQKDKQAGITLVINTSLPMEVGTAGPEVIDTDFSVAIDPRKLVHDKA